jgi:hypothetical protein
LSPTPLPVTAIVNFDYGLNLREEPSAESILIEYLSPGTIVIVLEDTAENSEGSWQLVQVDDAVGWVLDAYLTSR